MSRSILQNDDTAVQLAAVLLLLRPVSLLSFFLDVYCLRCCKVSMWSGQAEVNHTAIILALPRRDSVMGGDFQLVDGNIMFT